MKSTLDDDADSSILSDPVASGAGNYAPAAPIPSLRRSRLLPALRAAGVGAMLRIFTSFGPGCSLSTCCRYSFAMRRAGSAVEMASAGGRTCLSQGRTAPPCGLPPFSWPPLSPGRRSQCPDAAPSCSMPMVARTARLILETPSTKPHEREPSPRGCGAPSAPSAHSRSAQAEREDTTLLPPCRSARSRASPDSGRKRLAVMAARVARGTKEPLRRIQRQG